MRVSKDKIADDERDRCSAELREDRKSKSCALAGAKQTRLDKIFKGLNVFLKFTTQEFAAFGVKPLDIRDEYKQRAEQENDRV
jgi:hypothetical protein